jgi:hypothetical protein
LLGVLPWPPAGDLMRFLNDNGGLWTAATLVAMLALAVGEAIFTMRSRPAVLESAQKRGLLVNAIRRRRVELDLESRLVLGRLLEVELRDSAAGANSSPGELYDSLAAGGQVFVTGEAGAGKSVLALTLVAHSLDRTREEPESRLVETIPLREWRGQVLRRNDWKALIRWMAGLLADAYPPLGSKHFVHLLEVQQLIPVLDGLDEVPERRRESLMRCLRSYLEAGMPLVVLSRDREVPLPRSKSDSEAPTPSFSMLELQPLDKSALAMLPNAPAWNDLVTTSPQPHRVAHLLGNPLTLSVLVTGGGSEPAQALAAAEDPEDAVWERFFDAALGVEEPTRPRSLRRVAGLTALLARQRNQAMFRAGDLYATSSAFTPTLVLCTLLITLVCWGPKLAGANSLAILILALGLTQWEKSWPTRIARRVTRRWWGTAENAVAVLVILLMIPATMLAGSVGESFLRLVVIPAVREGHLFTGVAASAPDWWRAHAQPAFSVGSWRPVEWFSLMPLVLVVALVDLTAPQTVEWTLPTGVPRAAPPVAAATLIVCALLFAQPLVVAAATGATIMAAPFAYMGFSYAFLVLRKEIAPGGLDQTCRALATAGVLHLRERHYRFRHEELSKRLAAEAAARLADAGSIDRLARPECMTHLIDARIRRDVMERNRRLAGDLLSYCPHYEFALTMKTLHLFYGELRPHEALPELEARVKRFPKCIARVHIAEILDAEGKPVEAEPIWRDVVADYPWLELKWIRRQTMWGAAADAMAALEARIRELPPGTPAIEHVILAELRCRFGTADEVQQATEELEELRHATHPYLAQRATLELARVYAETSHEPDRAAELLEPIIDRGVPDSVKFARFAQLKAASAESGAAEQLGREALELVTWREDPSHQLEALMTAAATVPELTLQANARVRALLKFGWHLPGRRPLLPADSGTHADLLIARVFADSQRGSPVGPV